MATPQQVPKKKLHDKLFRDIFSEADYCLDIFRLVLRSSEFELLDWATLRTEATVTVGKDWKDRLTDLTFSVKIKRTKNEARIIFLLEHKSYQDPNLLIQVLEYQTEHYRKFGNAPVIPVLFYHGKNKRWNSPLNFQDSLKGLTPSIKKAFGQHIIDFNCKLLNLHDINFSRGKAKSLSISPVLFIMANIWQN